MVRNMKYHFKGIVGTDDDGLCVLYTVKESQYVTFDQMLRIMMILEGDEE